jgi:Flp pilus assembly secretin CpaC
VKPLLALLLGLAVACPCAERLTLFSGESRILPVSNPKKILLGNRGVAEARLLSPEELLLNGKNPGLSSLVLLNAGGDKSSYEIEVQASGLKKEMIEVDVQVLELSEGSGLDLGLDWPALLESGAATVRERAAPPLLSFGTFERGPIELTLRALIEKDKARLLAKPKLLTVSGGSAKFLAGGQVPVPQTDSQGHISTDYKDYGVRLDIEPRSDEDGNIQAKLRAEVSGLDFANAVAGQGGTLQPAIKARWVETTIYVKKNGTIVIAGLIQEERRQLSRGLPLLSQIPLLGELFKLHRIETSLSELVIFVTPKVL